MLFNYDNDIADFFDISIIIPLHNDLAYFKYTLPENVCYFQRNGIEVIVVSAQKDRKELYTLIEKFHCINWKILLVTDAVNENQCQCINTGIRSAHNKYGLVVTAEMKFLSDIPFQLRYMTKHFPESFATAVAVPATGTPLSHETIASQEHAVCGALMVECGLLARIQGFDEENPSAAAGIENTARRLELYGVKALKTEQAVLISTNASGNTQAKTSPASSYIYLPRQIVKNDEKWGEHPNKVLHHWKYNKFDNARDSVLEKFTEHWFKSPGVLNKNYTILCLVQIRNEAHYLPGFIDHMEKHCDGMILLDDGSEDDSFERAVSGKLLLKVKIRYKGYFDDLKNRNLLLELGHLFKADWFYFMDVDERFDSRYNDLNAITRQNNIDAVTFRCIHLWDGEHQYRKDIAEGNNGLLLRYRMFRNQGFMQIHANREVYFPATPFKRNSFDAKILIKHYGLMEHEVRKIKYHRYTSQDPDGKKQGYRYEYLLDKNIITGQINDITL